MKNVLVVQVKSIKSVVEMPKKLAKEAKRKRLKTNSQLKANGRTKAQIARKLRKKQRKNDRANS